MFGEEVDGSLGDVVAVLGHEDGVQKAAAVRLGEVVHDGARLDGNQCGIRLFAMHSTRFRIPHFLIIRVREPYRLVLMGWACVGMGLCP